MDGIATGAYHCLGCSRGFPHHLRAVEGAVYTAEEAAVRKLHFMPQWGIPAEQVRAKVATMKRQHEVEAIDILADVIRNQRHLVYCWGVTVSLPSLPSWDDYSRLGRKRHGVLAFVQRYLFPGRYKQLGRDYIDAQARIQDEFLNEVLSR